MEEMGLREQLLIPAPQYEAKQISYKTVAERLDNNAPRIVLYPFLDR